MFSCTLIVAIFLVLITTTATIVSFTTPHWLEERDLGKTKGIWLECGMSDWKNCNWFFANNFDLENQLPVWYKAVQGLMSCAVATSLLALFISLSSLCCRCRSCNIHHAAGAFANLTFLLLAVSVCLFGAKAHLELGASVNPDISPAFGWSFWLGVGAAAVSLIAAGLYFCVSRNDDQVV